MNYELSFSYDYEGKDDFIMYLARVLKAQLPNEKLAVEMLSAARMVCFVFTSEHRSDVEKLSDLILDNSNDIQTVLFGYCGETNQITERAIMSVLEKFVSNFGEDCLRQEINKFLNEAIHWGKN